MKIVYNYNHPIITEYFMQKVADFEGFSATPYECPSGVSTIGFGHTTVFPESRIDVESASNTLFHDLEYCISQLSYHLDSFSSFPIGLQQALVDFVFNCGIGRFVSSSICRKLRNFHKSSNIQRIQILKEVSDTIQLYCFSKGKRLRGLERRRKWESSLIDDCLLQR